MDTRIIRNLTFAGFLILVVSLFYYQILKGALFLERAKANYMRLVPRQAIRGSILDRNKTLLAHDEPVFNIAVIPYQISKNKTDLFEELSRRSGTPRDSLERNYRRNFSSFVSPVNVILDVEKEVALRLKEEFKENIMINESSRRYYPYANELSHVLGYVKRASSQYEVLKRYGYAPSERVGFLGVEQYYNGYLKGEGGGQLLEVDSRGKVVGFLGINQPQRGKDITLTLNIDLQKEAYAALEGRKGVILLMDPRTGELLVFCSRPSYNLNDMIKGIDLARIFQNRNKPLINRGIQDIYALGSVFKPVVAVAALEEGAITPRATHECRGALSVADVTFRCWAVHGAESLYDALTHSCNVYFYKVGLALGIEKIYRWAQFFGFGEKTGIDLPYEKRGLLPHPKWKKNARKTRWFTGDTVNISIGQGYLAVTPIQGLVAVSVFANGGYRIRPYLLKELENFSSSAISRDYIPIAAQTLTAVKTGMRRAVRQADGTAYLLDGLKIDIAGKTGTAQAFGEPHGWFVGFFPHENPAYSICVFLENASSSLEALEVTYAFLSACKEKGYLR